VTLHADGTYTYKPATGFSGTDNFKFKANDGTADSNAVVIGITVTEHAPVGTAQSFSMTHNTTHKGTVSATDKDTGDHLTFSKVALPKHGTLTMTTAGAFTYKPTTGFKGKDSFTFKVSDGAKADASTTVSITVK
jgi:VCBS repeat-containing protein